MKLALIGYGLAMLCACACSERTAPLQSPEPPMAPASRFTQPAPEPRMEQRPSAPTTAPPARETTPPPREPPPKINEKDDGPPMPAESPYGEPIESGPRNWMDDNGNNVTRDFSAL